MAMVINTNVTANRTHNTYVHNNDAMNKALTRVATGQKINSAKDGASTWAISEKMRERIRANDQANQNVQNDTALLRTAQGGIDNTISILKTIKERALNAANDSNINTDREAIATEVLELVNQIDDNAQKVKFNGRALLNGAADTSVTTTEETASTTASSAITEPKAAEFTGAAATTTGTSYVFKTQYLAGADGTSSSAATTALTDLKAFGSGSDVNLKVGDTITFSWKQDGEEQTKTFEVTSDSTLADLNFSYGAMKFSYSTSADELTDKDGNAVYKSDRSTAVSADKIALMAVGDQGAVITDFKVAVNYDNYGTDTTRVNGQNLLQFSGVQSVAEPEDGSHSVFALSGLYATAGTVANTSMVATTKLADIGVAINTTLITGVATNSSITFTAGDKSVTLTGDKTVEDLISAFKAEGIGVTFVNSTTGTTMLYDASNTAVKEGTGTDAQNFATTIPTAAAKGASLYFVGADGEEISSLTITATDASGNQLEVNDKVKALKDPDDYTASAQQLLALPTEEEAAAEESEGVTALTFYVGGESNFGIDVSINKMTTEALLGSDAKTFSDMFKRKETLNINSDDPTKNVISIIDNAIQTALNEQTKLGAMEARLGYTSDNITTMNENLEAADSAYRDSDIAKEMTNYMKYSVLAQASQYMLAQAGQNAYSVLNLLQQ